MDLTYQASGRIVDLKNRVRRCCCKYCGGPLEIKRIIFSEQEDGRIEIFCTECARIEYGIEPEIYHNACYFVDTMKFNCFPDLPENEKTRRMNIAKVSEIIAWSNKNMGFLDHSGFTVPLRMNTRIIGESIILDDRDITLDEQEEGHV